MSTTVELILGPARSGKAGRVLEAYAAALAQAGPGSCLLLVPTAARRRVTESRLLAAQPSGVLLRPQVLTLPDLAERLLTAAGRPVRRISELARRQVIRDCLARLGPKDAEVLAAVRQTPGLVEALDGLFRELKAASVEPDAFGNALSGGLRTPRNRVLHRLYDAYQKALRKSDVYDDAGQFWHAAALVAAGEFGPFGRLALLAVDGFQDFTPAQVDMLDRLSERAGRTMITLTWEDGRPNLFGVTARTRERLRAKFGNRLAETAVAAPSGLPPALEQVRTQLFRLHSEDAARPSAGDTVAFLRAAGRTREVEEVARQIADLVRGGCGDPPREGGAPADSGTPKKPVISSERSESRNLAVAVAVDRRERQQPQPANGGLREGRNDNGLNVPENPGVRPATIAVLARSIQPYAPLVREIFPRYGLAFRVEHGLPLVECPAARAAVALVQLQVENYSHRALARLLKSNYFVPSAFGADEAAARAAVRLARDAAIWKGRESYPKGLEYLRKRLETQAGVLDDSGEFALSPEHAATRRAEIDAADALLRRLFDALALPPKATRRAFADGLRERIRAAGLWTAACGQSTPEDSARDLKALAALEDLLEEVALLDEADATEMPLAEFLAEVTHGLTLATVPAADPADAPVVVMDVRQARALTFDHVFVLGVAEKEFPRRGRRHPFFDDAERLDLRRRGVDLADGGHDAEQEMLLFYLAATRARRTLTLAYPSLDAQGRPALRSHYVEEVERLFAADGPPRIADVGTRDLDLPAGRLREPRELLAATMFDLWGPGGSDRIDEGLAVLDALLGRDPAAETALAGLAAEWEREHGDAFGPFDGRLSAPDLLEDLCRRFPGQTPLSAGRIESFGKCPFTFLASDLLGLEPIEEPSPDLGPMELGLIYHGLLERFFAALAASAECAGQLTEATLPAALALLDETAAAYFKRLESRGKTGSAALWEVQKKNILRDVRRLLDWHVEKQAGWRTAYTEVAFGAAASEEVAPPGRREPIIVDTPHGPLRLRGRIDRIDLTAAGEAGYQVIDYKTGVPPSKNDMAAGTSFQLPIYLWAARELLGPAAGDLARAFFLPVRHPAESGRLRSRDAKGEPDPAFDRTLDRAEQYIGRFIDGMRQGLFPVYPRQGCPGHCGFQGICRYAQWRIDRKWQENPLGPLEVIQDKPDDAAEADA